MQMKRTLVLYVVILAFTACQKDVTTAEELDIGALKAQTEPTEVLLSNSRADNFKLRINSNGTIAAAKDLEVVTNASGYLQELLVSNGSLVKKGQLLGITRKHN